MKSRRILSYNFSLGPRSLRRLWMAGGIFLGVGAIAASVEFGLIRFSTGAKGESPMVDVILPNLALPEMDRKYLWDMEHHGRVLDEYGFKPLVNALKQGNADALEAILAADFQGRIAEQKPAIRFDADFASVSRLEPPYISLESMDRNQFVSWLLENRSIFHGVPEAKIKLMSLAPIDREELGGPWRGGLKLRMWGRTGPDSPGEVVLYSEIQLDRPERGRLDRGGWLHGFTVIKVKKARSDGFLMRETAHRWGIDATLLHDNWDRGPSRTLITTGGVYLCDFNRDGLMDLLVNDVALYRGYVLYQGTAGGKFKDVTLDVGLPPLTPVSLVAIVDLDGDGWEDLILGPGLIFRNHEGRRFENVSARSNLTSLAHLRKTERASGIAVADYDRDGRMDLYVFRASSVPREGSWVKGKIGDDYENQLLRNMGDWRFEDVTNRTGTDGGKRSTFSAVWWDANDDGWQDLYVIHEFGNGVLLVNERAAEFKEHQLVNGPADFGSMGVTCGDVDNDGKLDLYVASMYSRAGNRVMGNLRSDAYSQDLMLELRRMVAGSQLYHNLGGLEFERVGSEYDVEAVGWGYGPAMVDLDNDGWLDIYATSGFISRTREKPDG